MSWQLPLGAQVTGTGVRFRVWAPAAEHVEVVLFDGNRPSTRTPLTREVDGYWRVHLGGIGAGARYAFSVDGGDPRPDPASRAQPDGVHAPSEVIDATAFPWSDDAWRGVPLDELLIYELHVGTATPAGTFYALIEKLPYFHDLGVTALELLPISAFPGNRNWGYDGVDLYAPASCYGGPHGLKRLVDAAHAHGLAIFLDVVYNHFGPDGNYLRTFSPSYFSDLHRTPWGEALNLDGPNSEGVRDFLINNALYWAHEYHVDGLRLDATHALIDNGVQHLLGELTGTVRASLPADRQFVITAEDERNDARLLQPADQGGYGLHAVWADDFHHQARVALTGEQHGYFGHYRGSIADLTQTIRDGWFEQGLRSRRHGQAQAQGTGPVAFGYPQFVYCIQNHDQVGNRPTGERLHHVVDPAAYRALSALLLLVPETPLLFQGQEWAASTPFQFFTDHHGALGTLVTEGRRREFAYFLTDTGIVVPDPQAESTFERSKLRWNELTQPEHAQTLALYQDLIRLRHTHPALRRHDRAGVQITPLSEHAFLLRRDGHAPQDTLLAVVNLGTTANLSINVPAAVASTVLLDTNARRYGGTAPARLAPLSNDTLKLQMSSAGVVVVQSTQAAEVPQHPARHAWQLMLC